MISPQNKKRILEAIVNRVPQLECPMCHHQQFTIADGYVVDSIQDDYKNIILGGRKMIPSILLVCTHCGFISKHSLGVLGLLDNKENEIVK